MFWVGLPNEVERQGVMAAALRSHGRDVNVIGFDLEAVADATNQFSGAEIAATVPDAMYVAFSDGGREITTEDLLAAAKAVKPKGTTKVRPDFAREATRATESVAASNGRALDL